MTEVHSAWFTCYIVSLLKSEDVLHRIVHLVPVMNTEFGLFWRYLLVLVIFTTMLLSQSYRYISRDTLLAINQRRRFVVLDKEVRDVITRLQLHRRGCRAGEHRRRRVHAAQVMTSSDNCVVPDQAIPTIIGNRISTVINNNQYIYYNAV